MPCESIWARECAILYGYDTHMGAPLWLSMTSHWWPHFQLNFRSFCESYDMKPHSTKIFRDIVNGIGAFIQSQFVNATVSQSAQAGMFVYYNKFVSDTNFRCFIYMNQGYMYLHTDCWYCVETWEWCSVFLTNFKLFRKMFPHMIFLKFSIILPMSRVFFINLNLIPVWYMYIHVHTCMAGVSNKWPTKAFHTTCNTFFMYN